MTTGQTVGRKQKSGMEYRNPHFLIETVIVMALASAVTALSLSTAWLVLEVFG